ncbi:Protein CBG22325 [Caenorhabditis briggsae]|uniref:Protein CBG22325 n=1 Tax=Caenorhabditis briggsae TaxID=6238 RepID=A8Y227_CAEBR|nr:Protein CBG22325 [Caenorhabditis briggsae]CAP38947.2 Protein CBG22325 [Caenorhabditis briggsae]
MKRLLRQEDRFELYNQQNCPSDDDFVDSVAQPRSLFEEVLSPFRNKGALRKKMRKVRGRPQTSNNASTANPVNNSKVDSSAEIPQNLTNRDEDNQTVKRKLDEVMEKLQSIEESVSKIPKIENDKESTERTEDKVDDSSSNSMVSKPVQKEEKRFVLKHIFNNVASFDEETNHCSVQENHFNLDS